MHRPVNCSRYPVLIFKRNECRAITNKNISPAFSFELGQDMHFPFARSALFPDSRNAGKRKENARRKPLLWWTGDSFLFLLFLFIACPIIMWLRLTPRTAVFFVSPSIHRKFLYYLLFLVKDGWMEQRKCCGGGGLPVNDFTASA